MWHIWLSTLLICCLSLIINWSALLGLLKTSSLKILLRLICVLLIGAYLIPIAQCLRWIGTSFHCCALSTDSHTNHSLVLWKCLSISITVCWRNLALPLSIQICGYWLLLYVSRLRSIRILLCIRCSCKRWLLYSIILLLICIMPTKLQPINIAIPALTPINIGLISLKQCWIVVSYCSWRSC